MDKSKSLVLYNNGIDHLEAATICSRQVIGARRSCSVHNVRSSNSLICDARPHKIEAGTVRPNENFEATSGAALASMMSAIRSPMTGRNLYAWPEPRIAQSIQFTSIHPSKQSFIPAVAITTFSSLGCRAMIQSSSGESLYQHNLVPLNGFNASSGYISFKCMRRRWTISIGIRRPSSGWDVIVRGVDTAVVGNESSGVERVYPLS